MQSIERSKKRFLIEIRFASSLTSLEFATR